MSRVKSSLNLFVLARDQQASETFCLSLACKHLDCWSFVREHAYLYHELKLKLERAEIKLHVKIKPELPYEMGFPKDITYHLMKWVFFLRILHIIYNWLFLNHFID